MVRDLTEGSIRKNLIRFALPFLAASFLQTFYGLADLFITGQFNGAASISGVSIGSQVMHMLTVVIVGLSMGPTVLIARSVGAKNKKEITTSIGNAVTLYAIFAAAVTVILLLCVRPIMAVLSTPPEAMAETRRYMVICFVGIPFITAYNVVASIFRGLGDTTSPMKFVAFAGILNVGLDILLIGPLHMGASGAAIATVFSQAVSDVLAIRALRRTDEGAAVTREDLRFDNKLMKKMIQIGVPVALQEGFIQISFLAITAIANSRGVEVAAAVGIVEKVISFLFLVPSAMMSTVSAVTAQNAGAGRHDRGRETLFFAIFCCVTYGAAVVLLCQIFPEQIVDLFVRDDPEVVRLGGQYLRSYSFDTMIAGIHFCFSGYFSAYGKAVYSFFHNIVSVLAVRIPGAYLASVHYPDTLFPMGLAAPMGSVLSSVICVILYLRGKRYWNPVPEKTKTDSVSV
ncbi:MAG: MATE family efflux transporter [Bilifractor sp.]